MEEEEYGKVFLHAKGNIRNQNYVAKLIIIDPLSEYRTKEASKLLSKHLTQYPVEYIESIIPIIFSEKGMGKVISLLLIIQADNPSVDNTNPIDTNFITDSVLRSLSLCTSYGVLNRTRYLLPNIGKPGEIARATTRGGVISYDFRDKGINRLYPDIGMHNYQISTNWIDTEKFQRLVDFFNSLYTLVEEDKLNFHKISELVIDLFQTVMAIRNYRPKFLLLCVIYETIFKHKSENITHIAAKISRFLEEDIQEQNKIRDIFHLPDSNVWTVGKLRNSITHGDIELPRDIVKSKYQILHNLIRRVLVKFFLEYSQINHTQNYFEDLNTFLKNHN